MSIAKSDAYLARWLLNQYDLERVRDDIDRIKDAMETETDPRKYQRLNYLLRVAEAELESRKDQVNLLKGTND